MFSTKHNYLAILAFIWYL